jgi:hypothetical protein
MGEAIGSFVKLPKAELLIAANDRRPHPESGGPPAICSLVAGALKRPPSTQMRALSNALKFIRSKKISTG